jgi:hypothetical protein
MVLRSTAPAVADTETSSGGVCSGTAINPASSSATQPIPARPQITALTDADTIILTMTSLPV